MSPQGQRSALQFETAKIFDAVGRPGRRARAFTELRTTSGGRSHVLDVADYRWERLPRDNSGRIANRVFIAPDVAIEIVSPEQGLGALEIECRWYVDHGVPAALLLRPDDEAVAVFQSGQAPRLLWGSEVIDLAEVIPAFTVAVSDIFAALRLE